jgi:hypothetical protein
MSLSLGERVIVPAALTSLFALLSGGFMVGVGGATSRMTIVFRCAVLFMGGLTYSMAWQDKLAETLGWDDAWIAVAVAFAVGCVLLCRRLLAAREERGEQ